MKWWDDLWLNEGFASFAEYMAVSRIYPEWSMTDQFISSKTLPALRTDALSTSHPVSIPVTDPLEIEAIFDTISYNKVIYLCVSLDRSTTVDSSEMTCAFDFPSGLGHLRGIEIYSRSPFSVLNS